MVVKIEIKGVIQRSFHMSKDSIDVYKNFQAPKLNAQMIKPETIA